MSLINPISSGYYTHGVRHTECQYELVGDLFKINPEVNKDEVVRQNWVEQYFNVKKFSSGASTEEDLQQAMLGQRYTGILLASCGFSMPQDYGLYSKKGDLFDLFLENPGGIVYPQLDGLKLANILDNTGLIFDVKTRYYNGVWPLNPISGRVGRVKKDGTVYDEPWHAHLGKGDINKFNPAYGYVFTQIIEEDGILKPIIMGWLSHQDVLNYISNGKSLFVNKQGNIQNFYTFEISELRSIDSLLGMLQYVTKCNKIPNLGPIVSSKLLDPTAGPVKYVPKNYSASTAGPTSFTGSKSSVYLNTEEEVFGSSTNADWSSQFQEMKV